MMMIFSNCFIFSVCLSSPASPNTGHLCLIHYTACIEVPYYRSNCTIEYVTQCGSFHMKKVHLYFNKLSLFTWPLPWLYILLPVKLIQSEWMVVSTEKGVLCIGTKWPFLCWHSQIYHVYTWLYREYPVINSVTNMNRFSCQFHV
jgi:hypothetical protein